MSELIKFKNRLESGITSCFHILIICCQWFKNYLLFGYFTPYMRLANTDGASSVRPEHLPSLKKRDDLRYWSHRFVATARKQWERPTGPSNFSLIQTLFLVYWPYIISIYGLTILKIQLGIYSSNFLKGFLSWQELNPEDVTPALRYKGIMNGLAVVVVELFLIFLLSQCDFWRDRVMLRMEGSLATCLFRRLMMPTSKNPVQVEGSLEGDTEIQKINIHPQASVYNLLMLDIPSISRCVYILIDLLVRPVGLFMTFRVLSSQIGPAAKPAMIVLFIVISIVFILEIYNGYLKSSLLRSRDLRMHRCHDVVSDIRNVRMLGWEKLATDEISDARRQEMGVRRIRMYIHGISWALSDNARTIIQLTIFSAYVIIGLQQDGPFLFKASIAIPVLQIVMRFVGPLSDCSFTAHSLLEGWVSLTRYQSRVFGSSLDIQLPLTHSRMSTVSVGCSEIVSKINEEEEDDQDEETKPLLFTQHVDSNTITEDIIVHKNVDHSKPCIHIHNGLFSWTPDICSKQLDELSQTIPNNQQRPFHISIPHIHVKRGQCVILLGPPGSGKTSCILALLGEMIQLNGTCRVARTWRSSIDKQGQCHWGHSNIKRGEDIETVVGYSSQIPWLPAGTIRSTILFGRPYDLVRYNSVIEACDLIYDFACWPEGDQRMILQGGLNLSGGQRSRISLARAIYGFPINANEVKYMSFNQLDGEGYQGCKTFLLDDPFCSIDPNVGHRVFKKLVGSEGLLKHAGSMITMDQQNLSFFLNNLKLSNEYPGVEFLLYSVENGNIVPYPLHRIHDDLSSDYLVPLTNDITHLVLRQSIKYYSDMKNNKQEDVQDSVISSSLDKEQHNISHLTENQNVSSTTPPSSCVEQVYSGVVGSETYKWYGKYIGYRIVFLIGLILFILGVGKIAIDIWVAHWAGESSNDPIHQRVPQSNSLNPNITSFIELFPTTINYVDSQDHSFKDAIQINNSSHLLLFPENFVSLLQTNFDNISLTDSKHVSNKDETPDVQLYEHQHQLTFPTDDPVEHNIQNIHTFLNDIGSLNNVETTIPSNMSDTIASSYQLQQDSINQRRKQQSWDKTLCSLLIFSVLSIAVIFSRFFVVFFETFGSLKAAITIHDKFLSKVINAPFWVYDFIPIGVIVNRFSSDIHALDTAPLFPICQFVSSFIQLFITTIVLCVISPWCSPMIPLVGWMVYKYVYLLYRPTCREFQRSKLLALSPLCGNLSEAESGAIIIRAFGAETFYIKQNVHLTSELLKAQFMQFGSSHWASTRLQLIAFSVTVFKSTLPILIALIGFSKKNERFFGLFASSHFASIVGLAAAYAVDLPKSIGDVVLSISKLEQCMCFVQRIKGLMSLCITNEENQFNTEKDIQIITIHNTDNLPARRQGLEIDHVEVAYQAVINSVDALSNTDDTGVTRQNLSPALTDITVSIKPGQHIGVVGRTGAGKSTLLLSLLNLVPITKGTISMDGIPLQAISPDVRKQIIGILPQIPLVMKGWSVRKFLDPYNEFNIVTLRKAIDQLSMSHIISSLPNDLDTIIAPDEYANTELKNKKKNPNNQSSTPKHKGSCLWRCLSDSQLRMLAIARLSLHADRYRLVLVDEPPPKQIIKEETELLQDDTKNTSVFSKSDFIEDIADIEVGSILRRLFPKCAVILVAHYASTIKHCDSVWILSRGQLVSQVPGSSFTSQDDLMNMITRCEQTL